MPPAPIVEGYDSEDQVNPRLVTGVLRFCADKMLFAPTVLDQETLAAIAGYIVEVCEEWRWM
jgi:hypothetical protein